MENIIKCKRTHPTLGTLSKDVFERRTSTGSEAFSLFICLDANKLVLLSFFSLLKTIYPRVSTKPLPNDAKIPLPVDVRRSKTLLLIKAPYCWATTPNIVGCCMLCPFKVWNRSNVLLRANRRNNFQMSTEMLGAQWVRLHVAQPV